MSKQKKIKVGSKAPLVKNLLLIEGITRSGKFLLANILSGLEDIEPPQYSGLLEQLPFLASFGLIEKNSAKELLRCEIDVHCYEMLIGRNLNHRLSDKSSIYKMPNYQRFLERAKGPDGEEALSEFYGKEVYSLFILHESMANVKIFFETFPKMKCISITRNPLDLTYSWYQRGLGKRWGTDPILFQIPLASKNNQRLFPWFCSNWQDLYLKLNEIDRAILSVKSLVQIAAQSYSSLPTQIKKRILVVSFERLTSDPEIEITRISRFLGKKPIGEMAEILRREKLPIKDQRHKQKEKLKVLMSIANKQYLKDLLSLSTNYQL